jgi:hypothetical protein
VNIETENENLVPCENWQAANVNLCMQYEIKIIIIMPNYFKATSD